MPQNPFDFGRFAATTLGPAITALGNPQLAGIQQQSALGRYRRADAAAQFQQALSDAGGDPRAAIINMVRNPEQFAAFYAAEKNALPMLLDALTGKDTRPTSVQEAEFAFPGDTAKQREAVGAKFEEEPTALIQELEYATRNDPDKARQMMLELKRKELEGKSQLSVGVFSMGQDEQGRDLGQAFYAFDKANPGTPMVFPLTGRAVPGPMQDRQPFERTGTPAVTGFGDPKAGKAMAALGAGLPAQMEQVAGTVMRWFDQTVDVGLAQAAWRRQINQTRSAMDLLQRGGRESEAAFRRIEPTWVSIGALTDPREAIEAMAQFREMVESNLLNAEKSVETARSEKARNEATVFLSNMGALLDTLPSFDEMEYVRDQLAEGALKVDVGSAADEVGRGASQVTGGAGLPDAEFSAILKRDLTAQDSVSAAEIDNMSAEQARQLEKEAMRQVEETERESRR